MHVQSSGLTTPRQARARSAAAERIGDGVGVTLEDFARFSYDERVALFRANPGDYRRLADELCAVVVR